MESSSKGEMLGSRSTSVNIKVSVESSRKHESIGSWSTPVTQRCQSTVESSSKGEVLGLTTEDISQYKGASDVIRQ